MPRRSPQVEEFTPDNRSATMRTVSSDNSSNTSSSTPPLRRTRMGTMSLSVSAVSPARGTIPRMPSSESSAGSSDSTPQQRAKKRVTQLVFPYAPSIVPEVSFPPPPLPKPVPPFDIVNRHPAPSHQPYTIASEAEPLKSMPLCLIPKDSMRKLPPLLHLGWSIDEGKLLEWCASEGFQRTTTDINGHDVFDYTGTMTGALRYFAQRSGAGMFDPYIQLTCHRKEPVIVALTSNYLVSDELDGRRSEVFALASLLQREGLLSRSSMAARWYLDLKEWQWIANRPK